MTKNEKNYYMSKDTLAYYSGWDGIEIKEIEYGIEDYIIFLSNAWHNRQNAKIHKAKVYYTDNPYFLHDGKRIPLNECIRCNAF